MTQTTHLPHSLPVLAPKLVASMKCITCRIQVPQSFSQVGNSTLWLVNSIRPVVPHQHGIRAFQAYGLLGSVKSITEQTDYAATMLMEEWKTLTSVACSIFAFCTATDLFGTSSVILTDFYYTVMFNIEYENYQHWTMFNVNVA